VTFGAKVRDDGTPSIELRERVTRATELYRAGLARTVVMTGGIEPSGFDETIVMPDLAVAQGVPAEAIVLDERGVTTNASVDRTAEILRARGLSTVLAVSQPYHLPRIKFAWRGPISTCGPSADVTLVPDTARLVAREIAAFWLYHVRAVMS
jgi:vancomycin permeability regulator SanA